MSRMSYDLSYARLLVEESANQLNIISMVDEAVCLETGDMYRLRLINEGALDTIRDIIQKFIAKIKSLWSGFLERANELVKTDASFLQQYKNIILKNSFVSRELEMYQYNQKKIESEYTVPEFDFEKFKTITKSEHVEQEFIKTYLSNLKPDQDLKDQIINDLKGENEVTIQAPSLNPSVLYNYCINYRATLDKLKGDYNKIISMQGKIESKMATIAKDLEATTAANKKAEEQNNTQQSNTQQNNSQQNNSQQGSTQQNNSQQNNTQQSGTQQNNNQNTNESFAYSNLLQSYVIEKVSVGKPESGSKPTVSGGSKVSGSAKVSTGITSGNVSDAANKQMDDYAGSVDSEDEEKLKEVKAIQAGLVEYFTCCSNMLLAKTEVAQDMYKDYMTILKTHVRDYNGNKSAGKGNVASNGASTNSAGPDANKNMTIVIGNNKGKVLYKAGRTATVDGNNVKINGQDYTMAGAVDADVNTRIVSFAGKINLTGDGSVVTVNLGGESYETVLVNGAWNRVNPVQK